MGITAQNVKLVRVTDPDVIKDNVVFVTEEIDTLGFEYCQVYCYFGDTDIAMAVLKMQESATSGSGFVDITGQIYGTSTGVGGSASTLPSATDDNTFVCFDIDLRNRERYLDLSATAGNGALGTYMSAFAILSRGHDTPMTATERGCGQILRTT